jgi:hypothetical protein
MVGRLKTSTKKPSNPKNREEGGVEASLPQNNAKLTILLY